MRKALYIEVVREAAGRKKRTNRGKPWIKSSREERKQNAFTISTASAHFNTQLLWNVCACAHKMQWTKKKQPKPRRKKWQSFSQKKKRKKNSRWRETKRLFSWFSIQTAIRKAISSFDRPHAVKSMVRAVFFFWCALLFACIFMHVHYLDSVLATAK